MSSRIDTATREDLDAVLRLLEESRLPVDGLRDHLATTLVARDDGAVVGSAALEVYADGALLRSVAVAPTHRSDGLGRELTETAIQLAQALRVPAIYLLATTAEQYFPRFGFEKIRREDVPASVTASIEFTSACPSSATVMQKTLR